MESRQTRPAYVQSARTIRERFASDRQRPTYHFLPPSNWMNDPNGLIQWKGKYHLFYQYNPYGSFHDKIHWGHAESPDLVHWTDLPIALTPTPGQADAEGCWSGCAVNNQGVPTLVYSGLEPQSVCLATSNDDLLTWRYYPGNPVISGPPTASGASANGHFRDPFVWREQDTWYMLMGANISNEHGTILLYRSPDLIHWEYVHPLLLDTDRIVFNMVDTGSMWECPNLLRFGTPSLLLFSAQDRDGKLLYPVYTAGTYENECFTPHTHGLLAHGGYFYAPQVFLDEQGRYIMFGWLMEGRSLPQLQATGWAGVMSLPIVVSLLADNTVKLEPAPELRALREDNWHCEHVVLSAEEYIHFDESTDLCLEIVATCKMGATSVCSFEVYSSSEHQSYVQLIYNAVTRQCMLKRDHTSAAYGNDTDTSLLIGGTNDDMLTFHIFLDHSVLEIFINDTYYLASRIYAERPENCGFELVAHSGEVVVDALDIWHIANIWNTENA